MWRAGLYRSANHDLSGVVPNLREVRVVLGETELTFYLFIKTEVRTPCKGCLGVITIGAPSRFEPGSDAETTEIGQP